jgi:anti-sigma regulatory factor (Ser/Thr protein kinase)
MDNILFTSYSIEDRSYVSFVKREIHNLVKAEFSEKRTGEIDIVVSELASNIVKHARTGELLYRLSKENDEPLFEILSVDNGPGIEDVAHSMKDGVSTTNTLGQGMGSILRLSNFSQTYSIEDWGTIVYSRIYNDIEKKLPREKITIRCLNVAKPGETVSGDSCAYRSDGNTIFLFTGDGLGHGPHAKEAADVAVRSFMQSRELQPSGIIKEMNLNVKKTRGLVGTVAVLDQNNRQWQLCGVGNINSRICQGLEYKNYVCNNGIIGLNIPSRLENTEIQVEKYQQLIMASDGIRTRWDLLKYPAILKYDPMILAAAIYKDHGRRNDDMTVFILRLQ